MSLLRKVFGHHWTRDACVISANTLKAEIARTPELNGLNAFIKDGDYLCLARENLLKLLEDHVSLEHWGYKPDSFDCDDFAAVARGKVLDACGSLRMTPSILAGDFTHWTKGGGFHAAMLFLDAQMRFVYWDPQRPITTATDRLSEVVSRAGELWG